MPDFPQRRRLIRLLPPHWAPEWRTVLISSSFAFVTLAVIGAVHSLLDNAILVASLGGSAIVAFGMPDSEMARPRSLLGGHALSCVVGIAVSSVVHTSPWAGALAVSAALAVMQSTSTIHSPAGADPLIIVASNGAWLRPMIVLLVGLLLIELLARACLLLTTPGGSRPRGNRLD